MIHSLHLHGLNWTHIASQLNQIGFTTSRGNFIRAEQVKRLFNRDSN
ncbi:hypothetical protein QNI16_36055 [Cytophagaceae bacterium YF14B1]|uniref:Uncharacterized protein n=1 Tax=Xanthocytophaga flava TaxID=3048013 RepID=A0AAE3QZ86_9BACT|nr:hypothetical protein [Xanthocytophaga flavus]MDJ1485951.1 hypothetical protein [Xanthocytophaga flavus]